MLANLSAEELREWRAWLRLEGHPLDNLYEVLAMGFWAVCRVLGNSNLEPWEFMPDYLKEAYKQKTQPDFERFTSEVATWHSQT